MARVSAYVYKSRHNVFYFRLRVPLDLKHLTSQKEIGRSLKTSNRKQACIVAARWLDRCEVLFSKARINNHLSLANLQLADITSSHLPDTKALPVTVSENPKPLLSDVAKELVQLLEEDGITPSVIDGKLAIVRIMIEILGDLSIDQYSRSQCRKFSA